MLKLLMCEIMDRYRGVDVTIDGINYQVKPLKSYTIDSKMVII